MAKPLRKIIGQGSIEIAPKSESGGAVYRNVDLLECGHWQRVVTDFYGETHAEKRRCRRCA